MIHNGIEYGMMQAYAEGFALLRRKEELELDLAAIARDLAARQRGAVVAARPDRRGPGGRPELDDVAPWVADSGEGRWTVAEAIDLDVPAPVITLSLIQRLRSRDALRGHRALFA
jgi:6-phosphogluconate dehydrogenase